MHRRNTVVQLSALAATALRYAWPDSRLKRIMRACGVSLMTAKRIMQGEHSRVTTRLLDVLEGELEARQEEIETLLKQIRDERGGNSQIPGVPRSAGRARHE